jgi:hypothetical protein
MCRKEKSPDDTLIIILIVFGVVTLILTILTLLGIH